MDNNDSSHKERNSSFSTLGQERITPSNALQIPQISLPAGGGSLKSIDEKFQVNPANGTASFSIPLPCTPNRNGFQPQLSLAYNSGTGNSLFGIGWDIGLPAIQRSTDKKIPRYADSSDTGGIREEDHFMFSGLEELVPLMDWENNDWKMRQETVGDFIIRQYRPRIENSFSRIERIFHPDKGYYWRVTSSDNIVTFFGYSAGCRIADPNDATQVFKWLPECSFDDKGSCIWYEYKAEDLHQVANAYQENRGYDYEITRHISVRQLNPLALLSLKENGYCEFSIPEFIFDMDYPGHFKRRIKSVSVSVPCIAGPYVGLNATLHLLDHKFRNSALATSNNYPEKMDEDDDRFMKFIIPVSAITASSGQNDNGMFELNFKDERYLPFEGAGVISKWKLELPAFRQFDYDTISDFIISLRYTSADGGDRLKLAATKSITDFIKKTDDLAQDEGLFMFADLKHDLPTEWHKAMTTKDTVTGNNIMDLGKLTNFLPYYALYTSKNLVVKDFFLITSDQALHFSLNGGLLADSQPVGALKKLALTAPLDAIKDWKLSIEGMTTPVDKAFVVLRFVLD